MTGRRWLTAALIASIASHLAAAQTIRGTTTAIFAGVVTDSSSKPIANAEVTLPDLGEGTATNEQGAFVLRDIPAGSQRVVVRHVGYGPVEAQLTFVDGQTIERHITMVRSTKLDSVVVTEKSVDRQLDDFEVNKKLGLGHFLTRAELAPQEGRSTGAVLTTMPGIKVFAMGPYAWVGSGRHNATSLGGGAVLDDADELKRAPHWDCYALVYLDNHLVFRGQKFRNITHLHGTVLQWEPLFDINTISVASIEAIEYYATRGPDADEVRDAQFGMRRARHPHASFPPEGHDVSRR